MSITQFSAAYLHRHLDYNPITNKLLWNIRPGNDRGTKIHNARFAGKPAGHYRKSDGRHVLVLNGTLLLAYHVIWKMTYGEDPPSELDHANRITNDDDLWNLRPASSSQQKMNRGIKRNNTSDAIGVCWDRNRNKWVARVHIDGRQIYLGRFDSKLEAIQVRNEAAQRLYGEFAVINHH